MVAKNSTVIGPILIVLVESISTILILDSKPVSSNLCLINPADKREA